MFPGVQIEQLLNMTAASTIDRSSTCEQSVLSCVMLADNSGFPHDERGAGTFKLLSCQNHLRPELWLSGKGSRDARVIGFAQCSELS